MAGRDLSRGWYPKSGKPKHGCGDDWVVPSSTQVFIVY